MTQARELANSEFGMRNSELESLFKEIKKNRNRMGARKTVILKNYYFAASV